MCWSCGLPITEENPIGRSLRCQSCGKDLRVCKHCKFYMPDARGGCRETNAEPQSDKERATFCDWFSLDEKFRKGNVSQNSFEKKSSSKDAWDKLFS